MKKLGFLLLLFSLFGCDDPFKKPPQIKQKNMTNKFVVYDFGAKWCPPCRTFAPIFEQWSKKYSNENISFIKVDTDEEVDLASKYKISALPTVIVLKDGKEIKRFIGMPKEQEVVDLLNIK